MRSVHGQIHSLTEVKTDIEELQRFVTMLDEKIERFAALRASASYQYVQTGNAPIPMPPALPSLPTDNHAGCQALLPKDAYWPDITDFIRREQYDQHNDEADQP